jgi:MFS family permease
MLLAFTNASNVSFSSPVVWVPLIVGLICLVTFLVMQKRAEHPLINLDIFKSEKYTVSFIAQNGLFASYMGVTLILPLFIQNVCGMSALEAGAVFIPNTIFAMAINPIAGYACDRIGARKVCVTGGAFLFFGALLFVFCDENTPFWMLAAFQTVRGIGVSSLVAPLLTWGLSDLRGELVVDGSSFFTTVRMSFASLGTALMMLAISEIAVTSATLVLGYSIAFAVSAAFALITFVCCFIKVSD